jgi:TetR/AcrR family transcriptional regulator, tetracycline repressor protein
MNAQSQRRASNHSPNTSDLQRPSRGPLSRDQIIEAAITAIRAGRYEEMTIRSLASDLGVAPMTLYRHIRDRDDLLDEVTDHLLSLSWRPTTTSKNWQGWITDAVTRFRTLLVTYPAVLHVYLSHPVTSTAALDRMHSMLAVLRGAGFSEDDARRTYAALHTYTIGFSALEASRSRYQSTNEATGVTAKFLASFTTTEQFEIGLQLLISGANRTA